MKVLISENRKRDIAMKWLDSVYSDMVEFEHHARVPVDSKHFGFIDKDGREHAIFSYYARTPVIHSSGSTLIQFAQIFNLDESDAEGYLLTWLHKRFGVPRDIGVIWF